jgi:hypothetical protein
MKIKPLGKTIILFLAVYVLLLVLFSQFGSLYFRLFQGIFHWEIDFFYPQFKVASLQMEDLHGQQYISLNVKLTENILLKDGRLLHTVGRPYTAKTISINLYLHAIIIFSILAAWPGLALMDRFKVLLLLLPFLLILEMVDIPLLLATRCQEIVRANLYQDPLAEKSLGSYWVAFLHTGGRAALSILALGLALGCFYFGRFWRDRMTEAAAAASTVTAKQKLAQVGRNAPCPCGSGKKYKNCCAAKKAG